MVRGEHRVVPVLRGAASGGERLRRIGGEHREGQPELHACSSSAITPAPIAAASGPSAAGTIGTSGRYGAALDGLRGGRPSRREQHIRGARDATADHDDLRIEDVHEPGDPLAETPPDARDDGRRHGVSLPCRLDDVLAGHGLGVAAGTSREARVEQGRRPALVGERAPARDRLPAPIVAAPAGEAVPFHDHVPDLAGEPVGAAIDPSVDDDAAADPGADPDVQHVAMPSGRAKPVFAVGGGGAVVVDHHGQVEGGLDHLRQGHVAPGEVRRVPEDAGVGLDEAGRPDAHGARPARRGPPAGPPRGRPAWPRCRPPAWRGSPGRGRDRRRRSGPR